jgi:cysteinyl-tRNA synthetase
MTMAVQIYNTLSRRKEPFIPLNPPRVHIYNCGPTVYDHFHIGNARNFVVMDMVRRYLEYRGYEVCFVQNLTDIDDKIIDRAREENTTTGEVTARFIQCYLEDAAKLRIREADHHPKATEHIGDIVDLIRKLVDRELAYESNGSVYFSVRSFPEYGKLSGRSVDSMLEGARVEVRDEKRDPLDFVLWKAAKPGEPAWPSPWGEGRPGWHIECSCMSMKHLGETLDIHMGGVDLTFPHHENEIAQSEGATGKPFVRYWMHNGFLNIDREKMSKSLGNFMKIDQMLERTSVSALRHFLLSAHYRSPLDLSDNSLDDSTSAVQRINDTILMAGQILEMENGYTPNTGTMVTRDLRDSFESAMDDDFNTPQALAVLFDAVTRIHKLRDRIPGHDQSREEFAAYLEFAVELRDFFSLGPEQASTEGGGEGLTDELVRLLIEVRASSREARQFGIADRVRDRLNELGVVLEDHPQGTIWKKSV